ncbi:hypothetical protein EUX98_g6164 [Antrodiella citrinella]|uniref:F-box domain-containing protein n=1 Tax=Antrodiella citrinella TaxID=2447956 RepID=A0A4S4MPN7_9APHY|nr:hypothetical protein EUX98_g6164 [Antrodiella citrinella]
MLIGVPGLPADATIAATAKLPLDLTDRVIDFMHDDTATLRTCSLICRAFLRRSRYYRFRFVSLNQRTGESFERLLNTSPDVGVYVRDLHVSVSTFERYPTWVDDRLPRMVPKMPHVTLLHLKGNGEYRAAAFSNLTSVRELCLTHCQMYSMNEFVSAVGSFPHVDVIRLRDVQIGMSQTLAPVPPKLKKAPKVFEFSSSRLHGPPLVDWLISNNLHGIESLTLVPLQRAALDSIGKLVQHAGPAIKHLKIGMVTLKSDTAFAEDLRSLIGISSLTNLESLEFSSPALYAEQYGADDLSFEWILAVVDDVSSSLEHLVFYLWSGDEEAVTGEDWVRMSDLLKESRFSSLKKITFHVWGRPASCEIIIETIKTTLTELNSRNILHFDDDPDPEY